MNRKLIVTLLRKDIQELDMITEGFMELNEFPKAIIGLALRKSKDIQSYIEQLAEIKPEISMPVEEEKEIELPLETTDAVSQSVETETNSEEIETTSEIIEFVIEAAEPEPKFETPTQELEEEVTETIELTETETTETITTSGGETKKVILAEKISSFTQSRNEIHSKIDNSISSSIANKKIDDIRQAINIGDRFRFQRELFKGNGEDMNKTLSYINQLATLEEVMSFLQSKYNWEAEIESVEDFYQTVRRRFL